MVFKLFWPDYLDPIVYRKQKVDDRYLWIIGWKIADNIACVATLTDSKTEHGLGNVCDQKPDSKDLCVIGICDSTNRSLKYNFWMHVQMNGNIPTDITIKSPVKYEQYCIIYFSPPNNSAFQYYSLTQLNLDIRSTTKTKIHDSKSNWTSNYINGPFANTVLFDDLNYVLKCINLVMATSNNIHHTKHLNNSMLQQLQHWILDTSLLILTCISYIPAKLLHGVLYLLHIRIPIVKNSLYQLSTTGQQLEQRIQQIFFWPKQYLLWFSSDEKMSPTEQARYIGFFNTLWLIANDIIIGIALKTVILERNSEISNWLKMILKEYTLDWIVSQIVWLGDKPAGLKLNSELGSFVGILFQWMIYAWKVGFTNIEPYIPLILHAVAHAGVLGATFQLSMMADILSIATLHLQLFYIVSAKFYNWAINVIDSTYNLFRGKKRNPLRNRIDNAEYDLDQLLLGAVIFTLLVFLLPTVAVYYLLFCFCNVDVVVLLGGIEICLAFLNHFPLFALMLRIKDPKRLSDGIYFKLCEPYTIQKHKWYQPKSHQRTQISRSGLLYMYLESYPIGFHGIFYQYRYLTGRLLTFYLSGQALTSFLTGTRMKRLPKLQYPSIPVDKK
ncbi:N-acetylglucosaminyl transferase component-domain-containing protein [Globomyces pollinis-pini]|nr:N-acetylglucosaminyl transferase component-domain-containing protein [Globomyces pollinis-pini]